MSGHRRAVISIIVPIGILLLLLGIAACSTGQTETGNLLQDPTVGLAHVHEEAHAVRELATDPTVGLAHVHEEAHAVRELATDPKVGFKHLNDDLHTLQQMLADLSKQVQQLQEQAR